MNHITQDLLKKVEIVIKDAGTLLCSYFNKTTYKIS